MFIMKKEILKQTSYEVCIFTEGRFVMIQREDVVTEIKKFQSSAHSLLTAWLQYEGEFQVTDFTKDYFAEHSFEGVVADIDLWVDSCTETELSIKGFTKENTGGNCSALMFAAGKNEYCITEIDDPSAPNAYPVKIGLYIDNDLKTMQKSGTL